MLGKESVVEKSLCWSLKEVSLTPDSAANVLYRNQDFNFSSVKQNNSSLCILHLL